MFTQKLEPQDTIPTIEPKPFQSRSGQSSLELRLTNISFEINIALNFLETFRDNEHMELSFGSCNRKVISFFFTDGKIPFLLKHTCMEQIPVLPQFCVSGWNKIPCCSLIY